MSIIIPYFYIVFITFSLSIIFNQTFGKVLILSFIIPSFMIFLSGIFGSLKLGFYLSLILCLAWIPLSILCFIKNKNKFNNFIKNNLKISFIIFTVLFFIISIYTRYSSFFQWDDFSHWGPMVKEMFRLDKLYCINESLLPAHKDYPPIISILELLWCYLSFGFEERFLFRAISIFSVSLIVPFFDNIEFKNIKFKCINILLCIILFLLTFFIDLKSEIGYGLLSNFITIYPDALVGLFSAYIFYLIYSSNDLEMKDYIILSLLISFLIMIKQISVAFFLIIIIYAFYKYIFVSKKKNKIILYLIFIIILPLFPLIIWKIYQSYFVISSQFSLSDISISSLFNIIFLNKGLDYQIITKHNFINSIINRPMLRLFDLTFIQIIIILLISQFITLKVLLKNDKRTTFITLSTCVIGTFGYVFTMFVLYMFSYSEFEATNLASFERYIETYINFMIYVFVFLTVHYALYKHNSFNIKQPIILLILCVITYSTIQQNIVFLKLKQNYDGYSTRQDYNEFYNQTKTFIDKNDRVLIIYEDYDVFVEVKTEYMFLGYDFDFISLTKDIAYEITNKTLTNEEWQKLYSNYDYIFTFYTNDEFYENYWLNKQEEHLLNYRYYTVNSNGMLELVPWTPLEIYN